MPNLHVQPEYHIRYINLLLEMNVVWWLKHGNKSINSILHKDKEYTNSNTTAKMQKQTCCAAFFPVSGQQPFFYHHSSYFYHHSLETEMLYLMQFDGILANA